MVSHSERQRRYKDVRRGMKAGGYSALIISGNAEAVQRGYIRYLSDWRLWGGTGYMVFPLEGDPVLILGIGSQFYWAQEIDWVKDVRSGIDKIAEVVKVVHEIDLSREKIGIVGQNSVMTHGDVLQIYSKLVGAEMEDATSILDECMAIKSQEEINQMSHTYDLVDKALQIIQRSLKPGKTEQEIMAEAIHFLSEHGCFDGLTHIGHHSVSSIRPATDRIIAVEDTLKVFLEWSGPSGHWIELAGIYSFKQPDKRKIKYYDTMVSAVNTIISMMKPGAFAGDLSQTVEDIFIREGFKVSDRVVVDFHGIGLNVDTTPYGLPGSTDILRENMVLNIHPGIVIDDDRWGTSVMENIVVTPQGGKVLGHCEHIWHVIDY